MDDLFRLQLLSFLVVGLWTSRIFYENGRSRRVGLALGMGLHVLGLTIAIISIPAQDRSRTFTWQGWLLWGGAALASVLLAWADSPTWGWQNLNAAVLWLLVIMGLWDVWSKRERISTLPPMFWLLMGVGAAIAALILGPHRTDEGAYLGAWAWLIGGLRPQGVQPVAGGQTAESRITSRQRFLWVGGYEGGVPGFLDRYPIRGPLALIAVAFLFLGGLYATYIYTTSLDVSIYAFMIYAVMVGSAFGAFLLFMGAVGLLMGAAGVGRYVLRRPSKHCPRCEAVHTDDERQAHELSPGYMQLRCPQCGKEWKQARLRW